MYLRFFTELWKNTVNDCFESCGRELFSASIRAESPSWDIFCLVIIPFTKQYVQ